MPRFRKSKDVFRQWGGTTATFFTYTHFSHDLSTGLLIALLPSIRDTLGLSYVQSGLLLSAYTITAGLSQFPGGWLGDRFSRRAVAATGLLGVGLAALAIGLAPEYYAMLAILVVMGAFAGAYHPSATSMLSEYFEEARRGRAIALHMVGGSLGFTLGPVLAGVIAKMLGWRFAFIILSIPTLLAAPLVLMRLRRQAHPARDELTSDAPDTTSSPIETTRTLSGLASALRPIALITALAIVTQFVAGSAMAFIPIYLADRHNIAAAYATMWLGIIRGGGIAGSLLGGWLSDIWGRDNAVFLTLAATGPVLYLLARLPFGAVLIMVFVLFGMLMHMRQATVQPLLLDRTPPRFRATVFGIYFGLGMEGMSLLQPVVGHFMDVHGAFQVFHYIAIISVALSLSALLLAASRRLRSERR